MSKTIADFRLADLYTKMEIDDEEEAVTVTVFMGDTPMIGVSDDPNTYLRDGIEAFEEHVREILSRTSRSMLRDYIQGPRRESSIVYNWKPISELGSNCRNVLVFVPNGMNGDGKRKVFEAFAYADGTYSDPAPVDSAWDGAGATMFADLPEFVEPQGLVK